MSRFTMRPLKPEDAERVDRAFDEKDALVEFNPGGCLYPPYFAEIAQDIIDAPVREDDIWLVSYARTGSNWCQEMIWLIMNDLDFEGATNTIQQIRAPLVEYMQESLLVQMQPMVIDFAVSEIFSSKFSNEMWKTFGMTLTKLVRNLCKTRFEIENHH